MDDSLNESLNHTGCKNGRAGKIKPYQYSNFMDFSIPILIQFNPVSKFNRQIQASRILRKNRMNKIMLKKAIINMIGIAGVATLSSSLQAASFDCAKASTNVEKLICMDAIISQQDEQLEQVYKGVLGKIVDKESLRRAQRIWLKEKRNFCKDAMCLMQAYHERIAQLNSLNMLTPSVASIAPAQLNVAESEVSSKGQVVNQKFPLQFKLVEGDSYPLCQPYVDMLNKTKYMEYPSCERKLLPEFKQFKAIEWAEITDKKEMEKVLYNAYSLEDARYGRLNSPSHERDWKPKKESIDSGKKRLYFYKFDFEKDGQDEIVYKETFPYPRGPEKNGCDFIIDHTVFDKKISIDNVANDPTDNYSGLGLDGSDFLFLFNGGIINSLWDHYGAQYSIELWSINHYQALCKINVR
jgi:uncharacterized protein